MTHPMPPLWTEGLLLGPIHLQANDRYHEHLLAARLDALSPLSWGVARLDIDRRALAAGSLRVEQFIGVLPDGTTLSITSADAEAPATRPVPAFGPGQSRLDVWLGVPRARDNATIVGERSRYSVDVRRCHDVCTPDVEPLDVEFGRRNVQLAFGHEPREDLAAIKIGEVIRDSQGSYVLDESYVPPCVQIAGSAALCTGLERLIARMEVRRRALLASRRERDADTIEADATDVARFVLLVVISQALPSLHQLSRARSASAQALHARLLDLLGALSSFAVDASLEAPPFEYLDLRATFAPLYARLEKLLSDSHRESCFAVQLASREDGLHTLQLDDKLARCERFLLAVSGSLDVSESAKLVPIVSKVASFEQISGVVSASLPGAKLEVSHRPPPEVPVRAGDTYFQLTKNDPYWQHVLSTKSLAVFLPMPFAPGETRVQLIAIPPRGMAVGPAAARTAPPPPPSSARGARS